MDSSDTILGWWCKSAENRITVTTGDDCLPSHTWRQTKAQDMDHNANKRHVTFLGFVKIQDPVYHTCVLILKVEGDSGLGMLSAVGKRIPKEPSLSGSPSPAGAGCGPSRGLSRARGHTALCSHFQYIPPMDASPFVITFITRWNDHTITQRYVPATSDWNKLARWTNTSILNGFICLYI